MTRVCFIAILVTYLILSGNSGCQHQRATEQPSSSAYHQASGPSSSSAPSTSGLSSVPTLPGILSAAMLRAIPRPVGLRLPNPHFFNAAPSFRPIAPNLTISTPRPATRPPIQPPIQAQPLPQVDLQPPPDLPAQVAAANATRKRRRPPTQLAFVQASAPEAQQYVGKNGRVWLTAEPSEGRRGAHNVLHGSFGRPDISVPDDITILDSFRLFFSDDIRDEILACTNKRGDDHYKDKPGKEWQHVTTEELYAYVGILITAGVNKSWNVPIKELFLSKRSDPLFKAAMGVNRFKQIHRFLRFDDLDTRKNRIEGDKDANIAPDKIAAYSKMFNMFQANFVKWYHPSFCFTIDEQLLGFRGGCPILQYMPMKPEKYGMKIFWACDAETGYALKGKIYQGKEGDKVAVNLGSNLVKELSAPYFGSGRNVTCDNFFTSVDLADDLLKERLTLLGTIRKNKADLPPEFVEPKGREIRSTMFGFDEKKMMFSYKPKEKNVVVLLTTMFNSRVIDNLEKKKPEALHYYNKTKGGVDMMDEMVADYYCGRQINRWPAVLFFNDTNISCLNGFIIYSKIHPEYKTGCTDKRRRYLLDLGEALCKPNMRVRVILPQIPIIAREAMRLFGVQKTNKTNVLPVPGVMKPNAYCRMCPYRKRMKAAGVCTDCEKPICGKHGIKRVTRVCKDCLA